LRVRIFRVRSGKKLQFATSVAKAKVQSIAPVEGASRDAVASEPKAGSFQSVPLLFLVRLLWIVRYRAGIVG